MQARHVPRTGPRYWTALCVASVFGANMGDFASHTLHLGHARGLVPLAVLFALTLAWERRTPAPREAPGTEAFYWTAIVILRTAATNLGDLATHDFALPYPWVICGLAVLLALAAFASSRQQPADVPGGVPATTAVYWTAMLIAGTVGTAGGDYLADDLGLGVGRATIALTGIVVLMLALRGLGGLVNAATYWMSVAAIRLAGTTLGDYTAFRHGLGLGAAG